jgi:hypothetical protein
MSDEKIVIPGPEPVKPQQDRLFLSLLDTPDPDRTMLGMARVLDELKRMGEDITAVSIKTHPPTLDLAALADRNVKFILRPSKKESKSKVPRFVLELTEQQRKKDRRK